MNCRELRDRLTAAPGVPPRGEGASHVEGCAACARFVERLAAARQALGEHHAEVEPDAAFAGRVAARLDRAAGDTLGWAAVRLLPATLLLVAVLGWLAFRAPDVEIAVATSEQEQQDLLTWILEANGGRP